MTTIKKDGVDVIWSPFRVLYTKNIQIKCETICLTAKAWG